MLQCRPDGNAVAVGNAPVPRWRHGDRPIADARAAPMAAWRSADRRCARRTDDAVGSAELFGSSRAIDVRADGG